MFDTVVLDGYLELNHVIDGECGAVIKVNEGAKPAYTGPTEITPTQETQTLSTAQKTVLVDITINPIPSNYGLITWDGATLTVS